METFFIIPEYKGRGRKLFALEEFRMPTERVNILKSFFSAPVNLFMQSALSRFCKCTSFVKRLRPLLSLLFQKLAASLEKCILPPGAKRVEYIPLIP